MMYWDKINMLRRFLRTNWIKTIIFNFSMLPFRQALRIPIVLTRYTYIYSLSGKIIIDEPKVKFGMIRLGYCGEDTLAANANKTLLKIDGEWRMKGNLHLGIAVVIRVEKNAKLVTGTNVRISNMTKIICYDYINIGNNCRIAWESQLIDTNFHYMRNVETGEISELVRPVIIGNNCWIGNRTSIMKGTEIPDYTIVASGSLLNKKYDIPTKSLLAGSPAKLIKTGIYRCLDDEEKRIRTEKL